MNDKARQTFEVPRKALRNRHSKPSLRSGAQFSPIPILVAPHEPVLPSTLHCFTRLQCAYLSRTQPMDSPCRSNSEYFCYMKIYSLIHSLDEGHKEVR
ncbi:hypothetical protein ES702_02342 [subsurface metagenome]